MVRRPPRLPRTATLFPDTTLRRSLALERLRVDVKAQRRNLGLAVEDVEFERTDVGRHMTDNERRHLCADGLGIHGETPCGNQGTPARKGGDRKSKRLNSSH